MQLETFVLTPYSTEYYKYLKSHKKEFSPYVVGRSFEYRVMKFLRDRNIYCVRKFGSKGFEDIGASEHPILIQCKWSKTRDTKPEQFDLRGLIKLAKRFHGKAVFAGVRNHRMYFMEYKDHIKIQGTKKVYDKGWVEWKPN